MYITYYVGRIMKKYDGVLQKVRLVEQKNGIKYAKPFGALYKGLKIGYTVAGVWAVFMNLMYILGFLLVYMGTENFSGVLNSVITVGVCTALIILGYVLNCCKLYLAGGIISVVPTVFLIPLFALSLADGLGFLGYKLSFYWRHFIPLVLMIVLMVWLTVLAVRARVKTERQYKRVTENLFNMYNVSDGDTSAMTAEQWDEFLKNYDPSDYKKQFIKQMQ